MTNTITTTRDEITEALTHFDPSTILCELPEDAFETGSDICRAVRIAGYDESATTVINNLHLWRSTIAELVDILVRDEDE